MRVGVLMGGNSEERDVSLASGAQVARALREAGHEVVAVDTTRGVLDRDEEERLLSAGVQPTPPGPEDADLLDTGDTTALTRDERIRSCDVLFPALHGGAGEDGTLQALLELSGIPYAGSGPLGCGLAMDKDLSKRLFRDARVPTPDWLVGETSPREVVEALGLPVIVKPAAGGSTLGLTLVRNEAEIEAAAARARRYEGVVMYEAYVPGREMTVGILGREALAVGEIIPAHEIFDYECKYQPGMAEEIFPAEIPDGLAEALRALALGAHGALRQRDFSRVDFIVDDEGRPWCLEGNALPGMTATSLLPQSAAAVGIPFPELCDRIVRLALARAEVGEAHTAPGGAGAA